MTCNRSDPLAPGASYPPITLTVAVAVNAPASVTNTATVSGGGDVNSSNDSASDPTTIIAVADLTLTKTHTGSFLQGQVGATYTLIVSNIGGGPSSGPVTVNDTVPAGLTPTAAAGAGWVCNIAGQAVSCTRADVLNVGASYPAITLTVNVAPAAPPSLTNTAQVSGGGEINTANNTASDITTIGPGADLTITKSHTGNFTQGQTGATYTITVSNPGASPTAGLVTVTDNVPAGLLPTSAAGAGWTCNISAQVVTCTRSDPLATGQSYPSITLTVNVHRRTRVGNERGDRFGWRGRQSSEQFGHRCHHHYPRGRSDHHQESHGQLHPGTDRRNLYRDGNQLRCRADHGHGDGDRHSPPGTHAHRRHGRGLELLGWRPDSGLQQKRCPGGGSELSADYDHGDVAANAPASVTNTAIVFGGGETNPANNTATDPTTITAGPDLTIAKSHTGNFTQGQTGTYTLTVSNTGGSPTSGSVTVTDNVPVGLVPTSAAGAGWTCNIAAQGVTCNRSDPLAAGGSYPPITLTVAVAANAPASVTNTAIVFGGGEVNPSNNTAAIQPRLPPAPT